MKQSKNKYLGGYLRERRVASGLTQLEVATKLGYSSAQFISNWERGLSSPPVNKIAELTELYDFSKQELMEMYLLETKRQLEKKFAMIGTKKGKRA